MKTSYLIVCIFFLGLLPVTTLFISCNSSDKSSNDKAAKEDSLKIKIERGRYLAYHVSGCIDCHSQRDYKKFSGLIINGSEGKGGEVFNEIYSIPGVVFARNITPDTVNGIGKWTDEEIARAITRGISRNGDTLFPIMPYPHYNQMSKGDIYSIIAFLRTLKPNNNKVTERKLFVPLTTVYPQLPSSMLEYNVKPDVSDIVKYGAYMVNSAACMDCHTPMEKGKYQMDKLFSGGFVFNLGTFIVTTANITPDTATGIGKWTEEMFLDKFKHYRDPSLYVSDPGKMNSIMPWSLFAKMDDFDIKAIYRYLRTVPAVNHHVDKYPPAK
ncbi:MAG: cytochrome C [Chitinophagaceae bacterium]|nr:cytochrome C [Chitinophagaceae bacterium]